MLQIFDEWPLGLSFLEMRPVLQDTHEPSAAIADLAVLLSKL
jgi:hypothetical protein